MGEIPGDSKVDGRAVVETAAPVSALAAIFPFPAGGGKDSGPLAKVKAGFDIPQKQRMVLVGFDKTEAGVNVARGGDSDLSVFFVAAGAEIAAWMCPGGDFAVDRADENVAISPETAKIEIPDSGKLILEDGEGWFRPRLFIVRSQVEDAKARGIQVFDARSQKTDIGRSKRHQKLDFRGMGKYGAEIFLDKGEGAGAVGALSRQVMAFPIPIQAQRQANSPLPGRG